MKMQEVESSNINAIGYDKENKVLRIEFKGSGSYEYSDFQEEVFTEFAGTNSKGSFFHRKILKNYHGSKIK